MNCRIFQKTYPGGKEAVKICKPLSLTQRSTVKDHHDKNAERNADPFRGKLPHIRHRPFQGAGKSSCRVRGYDRACADVRQSDRSGKSYIFCFPLRSSDTEGKERAAYLLEKLELSEAAAQKLAAYSTGMRQRLSSGPGAAPQTPHTVSG